jgi:hypothetical protein
MNALELALKSVRNQYLNLNTTQLKSEPPKPRTHFLVSSAGFGGKNSEGKRSSGKYHPFIPRQLLYISMKYNRKGIALT